MCTVKIKRQQSRRRLFSRLSSWQEWLNNLSLPCWVQAETAYSSFVALVQKEYQPGKVKTGIFAAMMDVHLVNDVSLCFVLHSVCRPVSQLTLITGYISFSWAIPIFKSPFQTAQCTYAPVETKQRHTRKASSLVFCSRLHEISVALSAFRSVWEHCVNATQTPFQANLAG